MPSNRLEAAIRAGCKRRSQCTFPTCADDKGENFRYECEFVSNRMRVAIRAFLSIPLSDEEHKAVAEATWICRHKIHGEHEDGALLAEQSEMIQDWVNNEASAAIQASREHMMKEIGDA